MTVKQTAIVDLGAGALLFSLGMAVLVGAMVNGIVFDTTNGVALGAAVGGFLLAVGSVLLGIGIRKYE